MLFELGVAQNPNQDVKAAGRGSDCVKVASAGVVCGGVDGRSCICGTSGGVSVGFVVPGAGVLVNHPSQLDCSGGAVAFAGVFGGA